MKEKDYTQLYLQRQMTQETAANRIFQNVVGTVLLYLYDYDFMFEKL